MKAVSLSQAMTMVSIEPGDPTRPPNEAPTLNIAHRALRQSNLKRPAYRRFLAVADEMAHNKEFVPLYDVPVAWLDACWLLAVISKVRSISREHPTVRFPEVAEKVVATLSLRRKTAAWRLINGK